MNNQLIISVGREFGSAGHVIAEELSKRFNIPLYDHNLLDKIAEEVGFADATVLFKHFKSITGYSPGKYRKTFSKQ